MVAGFGVLLLVGPLMLLVEDDEPEALQGGEEGAAGANHHVVDAVAEGPPGTAVLGGGEAAVEHRHPAGEACLEPLNCLGREGYLRDKDDSPPALLQAPGQGLQVDLGLAAAGNALQKEGGPCFGGQGGMQLLQRVGLMRRGSQGCLAWEEGWGIPRGPR